MKVQLRKNPIGFVEVWPKPSLEELEQYYNDKYYGTNKGQYMSSYTDEEILHKHIPCKEALYYASENGKSLLEIGCGEGFVLDYFSRLGWNVEGAEFTSEGLSRFYPELLSRVRVGNVFSIMERLAVEHRKYDIVFCNNVLEHVTDPLNLLKGLKRLMAKDGICRIEVPNDDSYLQHELVKRGFADPDFWVCHPDHLNYFNVDSLKAILHASGLTIKALLSDFPIDMFLFNPDCNYQKDRTKGKNCHFSRVMIDNMIMQGSIEKLIAYRKGCAEAGLGRDLTAYCTQ